MNSNRHPSSVCILGGAGFIGSHLVSRLLQSSECDIVAVDLDPGKIRHLTGNPCLKYVRLDVSDIASLDEYLSGCDVVISLVALCNPSLYNTIPIDVVEANFLRPLEVVKKCADMGKWLIQFSTSEVYGITAARAAMVEYDDTHSASYIMNEDASPLILGPVSAQRWSYAASKQLLERMIYAYGFERGLKYTIVRPFNFIGPRMDYIPGIDGDGVPRVLACFMEALMSGKPLKLVDGGLNRRCFTYIEDAIDAIVAMLERQEKAVGEIFNIGNPANEVTIAQLAAMMGEIYGKQIRQNGAGGAFSVEYVSSEIFYGKGYQDSDRRMPDISKAERLLGWKPRTDLQTALGLTVASYIKDYGAECSERQAC